MSANNLIQSLREPNLSMPWYTKNTASTIRRPQSTTLALRAGSAVSMVTSGTGIPPVRHAEHGHRDQRSHPHEVREHRTTEEGSRNGEDESQKASHVAAHSVDLSPQTSIRESARRAKAKRQIRPGAGEEVADSDQERSEK